MSIVAPKGSDTLTSTPISDRYLSHPHRDSVRPDPTVAASSSSSSPSSPSSARSSFLPARAPLSRPSSASSSSSSHTSLAQNTTIKSKDPQQNRLPSMTISPSGDIPHQPRSRRAEWIVDLERAKLGEEAWGGKERVILVLGRPTIQLLSPILHNAQFESTLLLIPLLEPCPPLEALSSPSMLLSNSGSSSLPHQPVYPYVQTFTPKLNVGPSSSSSSRDTSHYLPPLLAQATILAQQWRSSMIQAEVGSSSRKSWMGFGGSSNSNSYSKRGSMDEGTRSGHSSRRGSSTDLFVMGQGQGHGHGHGHGGGSSARSSMDLPVGARPSLSIKSSSRRASQSSTHVNHNASNIPPFDAVLHFIPPPAQAQAPQRAMQEMLQTTVMLTSAITPLLAKRPPMSNVSILDQCPISLFHVVPPDAPAPLSAIIESFLLSFIPRFQSTDAGERALQGLAVASQAWSTPRVSASTPGSSAMSEYDTLAVADRSVGLHEMSAVGLLLFGGLSASRAPEGGKARAYLEVWPGDRQTDHAENQSTVHGIQRRYSALPTETNQSHSSRSSDGHAPLQSQVQPYQPPKPRSYSHHSMSALPRLTSRSGLSNVLHHADYRDDINEVGDGSNVAVPGGYEEHEDGDNAGVKSRNESILTTHTNTTHSEADTGLQTPEEGEVMSREGGDGSLYSSESFHSRVGRGGKTGLREEAGGQEREKAGKKGFRSFMKRFSRKA